MIEPSLFFEWLHRGGVRFYSGVPDSLLKDLCAYVTDTLPSAGHIIAANEGSAVALAAGRYLATGEFPVVYLQNSGLGNAVNPLLSLSDPEVYHLPVLLVIGWRGEPGVKDEPQHLKQGKVTLPLLQAMGIPFEVLSDDPRLAEQQAEKGMAHLEQNRSPYALVIRKGTFAPYTLQNNRPVDGEMSREEAIEAVIDGSGEGEIFVSTTGMASRELYEIRKRRGTGHHRDFLTVGSMGHASQIALARPERQITCIDGDGAFLMQMGGVATIGAEHPLNFTHILLNNGAHDSVGGQPTAGRRIDLPAIARGAGYSSAIRVTTREELERALRSRGAGPNLIEVIVRKGARKDLGRPKETPQENRDLLIDFIRSGEV